MSDEMMFGIAKMPYEMAMGDEMSRRQFYANTQRLAAALEAAREHLRDFATGKLRHVYRGGCPDQVNGPDARDPACPACQAIEAARFGSDANTIRELLAERDQLAAALEAARVDAERYRWLRDREIPEWLDLWHQNPDRIDAAIDAAMEGEKGQ